MPVRTFYPTQKSPHFDELVEALASELRQPRDKGQPLILEEELRRVDGLQVYVIWDRFVRCPEQERPDVIAAAYERAKGKEARDRIFSAYGLTVPEAADAGLLPYRLERIAPDVITDEQAEALLEEGASSLRGKLELRFRTLEDANSAYDRLVKRGFVLQYVHDVMPGE
jgi:hypothetical protein